MRRVLFVDDEPRILQGLERAFMVLDNEWEMEFVGSGKEALERLDARPTDVLITDMRMAGMDGAELLQHAADEYPAVVRLVLSGQASREAVKRALPVAHRFLSKPCDPDLLREVVERSCRLQELLDNAQLREIVGKPGELDARPNVYVALERALASSDANAHDIAAIVGNDSAMCARLLQLVNSSVVGLRQSITDIERAVAYVGATMLKNLVLSYEIFSVATDTSISLDEEYHHALTSAAVARSMFTDARDREAAYTAALLHDIGKVIIARARPQAFDQLNARSTTEGRPPHEIECETSCNATHAEVGAYVLRAWELATPVVEAAAHHHVPWRIPSRVFDLSAGVYAANILAREAQGSTDYSKRAGLNEEYLESLGVTEEQVATWRDSAKRAANNES